MKKILTIIALSLVAVVAVGAIVTAFVKQNYNQLPLNKIEYIEVFSNGKNASFDRTDNKDTMNKIIKLYEKGTKESVLSSLFQGAYSSDAKPQVIDGYKAGLSQQNINSLTSGSETYLMIHYYETHTLKVNGKVYESPYKTEDESIIEYKDVLITISNTTSLDVITVYIIDLEQPGYSTHQIKFLAKHSELYDYITNSEEFVLR